jgi:CHAT domain-containing protein/Tfp pilus assembly protein PilF
MRVKHTLRRIGGLLLILCLWGTSVAAQEARWEELLGQVSGLYNQGKYAEAVPIAEQALRVAEATFGAEDTRTANSVLWLAALHNVQRQYSEAEPLFKRGLAIREKALGPDHPDVATSLNDLAGLYKGQGRYAEAEPLYKRALAIREKALGPEHPDVATSLNNLAVLYDHQGRYAEAEPLLKRALAIDEKALGPEHPDVATALGNLAELYRLQGRYAETEPLCKRSLAILEKAFGPDYPVVASGLNNLGLLYWEQGRYGEAEPLFRRALTIKEKALGPDHPAVALSLNNLASLYEKQGRYGEAEPLYKRAIAIFEKALGPDHPDVAISLNTLGELYRLQGRYAEAEPLHNRALAIREKAFGPDHRLVATSLNNLGLLYWEQGRYAEAEPLLKRALAIVEKALGSDHPNVATSLDNLAGLYEARGEAAQAAQFLDRSLLVLARRFDYYFSYMSEKERLQFLATIAFRFPAYFSFCLSHRQQLPELTGKMYDLVLWEKGFIAQSAAALRARIRASGDAESLRMLDELTAKKSELAKLAGAPAAGDVQRQAQRREQIEQLEKAANELEKELVKRSGTLAEDKRLAHVTWQQVRDALKPDEAAVEIVRFNFYDGRKRTDTSYYVALIVTPQSQQPAFVVLGEQKNLEGAPLQDYLALVAEPDPNEPQKAGAGRKFYAAFWQPLEAALGGSKRVYLSPDGVLSQVSLGVAPRSDGKLLMEAYDLRTVTSTKDLLRQPVKPAANAALLMGNPKFDLTEAEQRAAVQSSQPQTTLVATTAPGPVTDGGIRSSLRSRDLRSGELKPLPGTQQEVTAISSLLAQAGWKVETDTQAQALEERVKAARAPRVLHLATHGFFETDQQVKHTERGTLQDQEKASGLEDPMLRSGVYLAGANRILKGGTPAADMDDGVLTAFEATQLNLQGTELVVLSACETGLGKSQAGEGVFGLQRGLQEAGAQAVVMSMWSVPDKETQELMTLFYQKWLAGTEKHEALRQAQQEMRAKIMASDGRDEPFYWGAFVLVGR